MSYESAGVQPKRRASRLRHWSLAGLVTVVGLAAWAAFAVAGTPQGSAPYLFALILCVLLSLTFVVTMLVVGRDAAD